MIDLNNQVKSPHRPRQRRLLAGKQQIRIMTKLTIITINRNNAEGLRKTIESVVSQTFTDFEYKVIDGASTDEKIKLQSYALFGAAH